VIHCNITSD